MQTYCSRRPYMRMELIKQIYNLNGVFKEREQTCNLFEASLTIRRLLPA